MKDHQAQSILDNWGNLRDKAINDLIYLMKAQDIKHIVCRSYTPRFNDGDPCEQTIQFVGVPNYVHEDYFVYLNKYGKPEVMEDGCTYTELLDKGVAPTIANTIKEWHEGEDWKPPSQLLPKYPLEGFDSFLWNTATIIFPTDCLVLITLKEDGTLDWQEEIYDCGY